MSKNTKYSDNSPAEENKCCELPIVLDRQLEEDIDPNRLSLTRYIEKKWVNHTVLHFHFLDTPNEWKGRKNQKDAVTAAFSEWIELRIGLEFREVADAADAEIRIGFAPGGSWSYVGRDAIDLITNPNDRTMNFGWDLTTAYGRDTALHEIGHALGFPHEHQNPHAGIVWDEEAVYANFNGPPNNWDRDRTFNNIIRKISPFAVDGSQWDRNSIMHYAFQAGLILTPEEYRSGPLIPEQGLSNVDIDEVRRFYPPETEVALPELKEYLSQLIEIDPGEQIDVVIKPTVSRNYTMQTFGPLDTVMVLFEDTDGDPVYLAGDDDSGSNFNSRIQLRLIRNRTYYLRIRLYFADADGKGAVMLW